MANWLAPSSPFPSGPNSPREATKNQTLSASHSQLIPLRSGGLWEQGREVDYNKEMIGFFDEKGHEHSVLQLINKDQVMKVVVVFRSFGCKHPSILSQNTLLQTQIQLAELGAGLIIIGRGSRALYQYWLNNTKGLSEITYYAPEVTFDDIITAFGARPVQTSIPHIFVKFLIHPEHGVLFYKRPRRLGNKLSFKSIFHTIDQFGREYDESIWGHVPAMKESLVTFDRHQRPELLLVKECDMRFCHEVPQSAVREGVKLIKETPLRVTDEFYHYTCTIGSTPVVISVLSTPAKGVGVKTVLWLPAFVKRVFIPLVHTETINKILQYTLKQAPQKLLSQVPSAGIKFILHPARSQFRDQLNNISTKLQWRTFKFGALLMNKESTGREEELYANDDMTPEFTKFLEILGTKVELDGFKGFSGGLVQKSGDTIGSHSYYSSVLSNEVMFHVGPMLPNLHNDPSRKRHIGNDIVTIVFVDKDCQHKLDLTTFVSQFNHVWIVVSKVYAETWNPNYGPYSEGDWYHISISTLSGINQFLPYLPDPPLISEDKLRDWLLTKCINAERTVIDETVTFGGKVTWTRERLLNFLLSDAENWRGSSKIVSVSVSLKVDTSK